MIKKSRTLEKKKARLSHANLPPNFWCTGRFLLHLKIAASQVSRCSHALIFLHLFLHPTNMPDDKEPSDEQILAVLAKESKEFDKVRSSYPSPFSLPPSSLSLPIFSLSPSSISPSSLVLQKNNLHLRTPKSIASSKPSVSMPTPSSTYNPESQTTTSRNATAQNPSSSIPTKPATPAPPMPLTASPKPNKLCWTKRSAQNSTRQSPMLVCC